MLIQHFYGVYILLNSQTFSPNHRKFAVVVTNLGRFVTIFGLILCGRDQIYIIGGGVLSVIMLVATIQKVFLAKGTSTATPSSKKTAERERSPPRNAKRD